MDLDVLLKIVSTTVHGGEPRDPTDIAWLADALALADGVELVRAFVVVAALNEDGTIAKPNEHTPVAHCVNGKSTQPTPETVGDLNFFGRAAPIGDLRPYATSLVDGPNNSDTDLTASRQCLFIHIKLESIWTWFLVYGRKGSIEEQEIWGEIVHTVLDQTISQKSHPTCRRRAFLEAISKFRPQNPADDFRYLCRAWRTVGEAAACGLWLVNLHDEDRAYELVAYESDGSRPEQRETPNIATSSEGIEIRSAGHYASRVQMGHVWIEDIDVWEKYDTEQGDTGKRLVRYEVRSRSNLRSSKFPKLLLVPLLKNGSSPGEHIYSNVIALHYRSSDRPPAHDKSILRIMGQLTAKMVELSQEHEQFEILKKLNEIESRHLGEPGRLSETRPQYVNAVIALIQDRLRIGLISLFYCDPIEKVLECIGTTGLMNVRSGSQVPKEALSSASYPLSAIERNTVRCFLRNAPIVTRNRNEDTDYLYSERKCDEQKRSQQNASDRISLDPDFDPTVYVPIPDIAAATPPAGGTQIDGLALGVMRCFRHQSHIHDVYVSFDQFDLDILQFIAKQIAPVLKIFQYRIERERAVITVKHDLHAPTRASIDTVDAVLRDLDSGKPVRRVDLADVRASIGVIRNMIGELDPEPEIVREFSPRPTFLEAGIVARLRDMLQPFAREERQMEIRYAGFREIPIPRLNIDKDLIERALFNLIINGIKYGRRGSELWIYAREADEEYLIDVENEGEGVSEQANREYLFAPGYRTRNARRLAHGAGLGLTIARAAVRRHGGELELQKPYNPTRFRIRLPKRLKTGDDL